MPIMLLFNRRSNNDKWNYKNMVMLSEYEKREIDPKIVVTDADCRAYYEAHRDRFVDGEVAVADILTFTSRGMPSKFGYG